MLEELDWDSVKEAEFIAVEQKRVLETQRSQAVAQAAIQGEAQLVQVKYQSRAQKIVAEQQVAAMAPQDAAASQQAAAQVAGQPGAASPDAIGAQTNSQVGQANRAGQVPPAQLDSPGGNRQGDGQLNQNPMAAAQSPLQAGQQAGVDIFAIGQKVTGWLNQLPDHEKAHELARMRNSNPQLYSLILPMLQQTAGANMNSAGMAPPPQKPARRGPEAATV